MLMVTRSFYNLHIVANYLCRKDVVDAEVNPKREAHVESSSIFQILDQLENVADELLAG
jgi:hypothetical protein